MDDELGFIKIYRRIMHTKLWLSKPFTEGQAWVDLLMLANHKEGMINRRGIRIVVERGMVGYGEESLAKRWQWSRGKVRRFLSYLESRNQLVKRSSPKTVQKNTTVSSCIYLTNYDLYQDSEQKTDRRRTEDGTGTKNDKNKKKTTGGFTPPSLEEVKAYCISRKNDIDPQAFIDFYQSKGWVIGKSKMKCWKSAVHTWENRRKDISPPSEMATGVARNMLDVIGE